MKKQRAFFKASCYLPNLAHLENHRFSWVKRCFSRLARLRKQGDEAKNTLSFQPNFLRKLAGKRHKNDAKMMQTAIQNSKGIKHDGKCASISIFCVPTAIFGRFWDPLGSQNGLQNWPWELNLGLNWALGVPREPQEPILVDFWSILESFWVPRWSSWDLPGTLLGATSSKQQQR